ncbi:threonine/serine exporter family protein [Ornithinimicrobium sp. F0845]|uniref:threonine/serine ThrE exporter family protein n=1 Tax=Ornithinimicrobium sp. F0845 TaxID=2926412 RepID=UPI001FF31385|nr:threonine/serine exporter family protein [Ornithinimicrobium sp. F0845]
MPAETDETRTRRLLAWLGCGLLAGGMPVHEAEEDVRAVAAALGHPRTQVACSPNAITLSLASGEPATLERVEGGLRLDQLAEVSVLQAGLRTRTITVEDALAKMSTLRAQPHRYAHGGLLGGGLLAAVGIALVLAPSWPSVLFAALIAPWTVTLMVFSGRSALVRTLMPFFAAFIAAMIAFLAAGQGLVSSPLWTLVAPIAVLLPGALIVTGLTELAAGSMMAGTARLGYGATQLLLFALGMGAAVVLLRVPPEEIDLTRPLGWWAPVVGVVIVTIAISLMESVSISMVPWLLATILATFLALTAGNALSDAPWLGAFLGATAASLVATVVEFLRPQLPRVIAFLPSFWLLVPGSLGLVSLTRIEVAPDTAIGALGGVVIIVAAIALGIVVGAALARPMRSVARRVGLLPLLRRLPGTRRRLPSD